MRNSFEMVAGDSYQLAGVHSGRPGAVFYEEQPAAGPPAPQHSGQAQQQAHRPGSSWSEAVEEAAAKASSSGGHGQQEEQLDDEPNFVSQWAAGGWLLENPMQTPTERELHVLQQGLPVYRMLLVKK